MGIFLPLAETVRRFNQLTDLSAFFSWFDDYILGAILLYAAYRVSRNAPKAIAWLIAAWGIAAGALFLSFIGQFEYYQSGSGDPGIFSTTFVAVAKGLILSYMIIGMVKAIKGSA
jgi:hypothetical protein